MEISLSSERTHSAIDERRLGRAARCGEQLSRLFDAIRKIPHDEELEGGVLSRADAPMKIMQAVLGALTFVARDYVISALPKSTY